MSRLVFQDDFGEDDISVELFEDGMILSLIERNAHYHFSTAETKALLQFLKKNLQPKLENV